MNENAKAVARAAADEIRALRRQNEVLAAKVHMIEFFESVLHTRPAMASQPYAEDVAWKLDQIVDELGEDA